MAANGEQFDDGELVEGVPSRRLPPARVGVSCACPFCPRPPTDGAEGAVLDNSHAARGRTESAITIRDPGRSHPRA